MARGVAIAAAAVAICTVSVGALKLPPDGVSQLDPTVGRQFSRSRETSAAASCGMQLSSDQAVVESVLQEVTKGNYNADVGVAWDAYQAGLVKSIQEGSLELRHNRKHKPAVASGRGSFKVLVVLAVADWETGAQTFEDNMHKMQSNTMGDTFEFAVFHHDSSSAHWEQRAWYTDPTGPVVLKHKGPGCKPHFWDMVTPNMAEKYDYLWLLDEDIRLDFFSWDLYRTFLDRLEPLVSQPSILPKAPGLKATGVQHVNMHQPNEREFTLAFETSRSEVQAPVIDSRIWRSTHARNRGNDLSSDFYIDDFWDIEAFVARLSCNKPAVLVVNAAPVRHMNCHNLIADNHLEGALRCKYGCGENDLNCRNITESESVLVRDDLRKRSYCDIPSLTDAAGLLRTGGIHDVHNECVARLGGLGHMWKWNTAV